MIMKSRCEFNTMFDWLFYLQNDLGYKDLTICGNNIKKDSDEIYFTKWYKFLDLQHYDFNQKIAINKKETYFVDRTKFIKNASHRSILDIELCIDIDDKGEFETIKEKTKSIIKKLQELNSNFKIYFTGSKSYHIHIFDYELKNITEKEKKNYLFLLGADTQKIGKNLIALEGAKHYKSGKIKEEVNINEFIN